MSHPVSRAGVTSRLAVASDRGFMLTELMIVLAAIAVIANVALPMVQRATIAQQATRVVSDLEKVRTAAERLHQETHQWPPSAAPGETPIALTAHLPAGFSFQSRGYALDWERHPVSAGPKPDAARGEWVAVSVITEDARLAASVVNALGDGTTHFTLGNRTTVVIDEPAAATP